MPRISIHDKYMTWVTGNVEPLFKTEGITMSQNAKRLVAFAMQVQVDDDLILSEEKLFERANKLLANSDVVKFYKERYGVKEMDFNRAFHLLADLGTALKFPFTTSV